MSDCRGPSKATRFAQTYVGEIFEKGLAAQPDYQAAAIWYRKAAEQGYSRAMINLGFLYEKQQHRADDPIFCGMGQGEFAGSAILADVADPGHQMLRRVPRAATGVDQLCSRRGKRVAS